MWNSPLLITSLSEKELLYKQISWALACMMFWSTTITISFCFSLSTIVKMHSRVVWTGRLHEIKGKLPTIVEGRVEPFFWQFLKPVHPGMNFPCLVYFQKEECSSGKGISIFALLEIYIERILWTWPLSSSVSRKMYWRRMNRMSSCSLTGQYGLTLKCLNNSHGVLNLSLVLCVIPLTESVSSMKSLLSKTSANR